LQAGIPEGSYYKRASVKFCEFIKPNHPSIHPSSHPSIQQFIPPSMQPATRPSKKNNFLMKELGIEYRQYQPSIH
jgi:hypothetical protein